MSSSTAFSLRNHYSFAAIITLGLSLISNDGNAYTINLTGVDAGYMAARIGESNFAGPSSQLANGTVAGPAVGTITGGAWTGYQSNRTVSVSERLDVYSGYTLASATLTAGSSGQITPATVHRLNLHNEIDNWDSCCGLGSLADGQLSFRFESPDYPGLITDGTGAAINSPLTIYFAYDWVAKFAPGGNYWGTTYTATGWNPAVGASQWTMPVLPHYNQMPTGTFTGTGYGSFQTWNPTSDFLFNFSMAIGGAGTWGTSTTDVDLRLAFSDQPFDVIPSSTVPVPGALWLLGSGLLGLIGFRRKS